MGRRKRFKIKLKVPYKFFCFCLASALLANFLMASNIEIKYNEEKAKQVRKTWKDKSLDVFRYIGQVRKAIF